MARSRHYLMCRPDHFAVDYAINPWMDPAKPADAATAIRQWERLSGRLRGTGPHGRASSTRSTACRTWSSPPTAPGRRRPRLRGQVRHPGARGGGPRLPALVHRQRVRPRHRAHGGQRGRGGLPRPRRGDPGRHRLPHRDHARTRRPRSSSAARWSPCNLVDPRFYHLDTALFPIDGRTVAYYPGAFSPGSQEVLARMFPDAVLASAGRRGRARPQRRQRRPQRGHERRRPANWPPELQAPGLQRHPGRPVSELRKAGGGPKCCTLEIRGSEQ